MVHSSNVFTSFDLAQGHLHLAMAEEDIKKTAFRADSSGLFKFTLMPFGLSNAGSSFCRLMEQCLVISSLSSCCCILMASVFLLQMLAPCLTQIGLVFNWLRSFNFKNQTEKMSFFQASMIFLGHILSADGKSANPEKVDKIRDWLVPNNCIHS